MTVLSISLQRDNIYKIHRNLRQERSQVSHLCTGREKETHDLVRGLESPTATEDFWTHMPWSGLQQQHSQHTAQRESRTQAQLRHHRPRVATCGNGDRGSGICYGWCGNIAKYCNNFKRMNTGEETSWALYSVDSIDRQIRLVASVRENTYDPF